VQGLRRAAEGVHEKLRRTDMQERVSDVHQIVQIEMKKRADELISFLIKRNHTAGGAALVIPGDGSAVAENQEAGRYSRGST
jgi:hypothetical protein